MSKPIDKEYLKTQLKNFDSVILNEKYVGKVDGMGLSQENFTTELKEKLDGLEEFDATEIEESIAELPSKEYVAEQIALTNHLVREIVTEIPTSDNAKDNVIYMFKVESATGSDVYQEYQKIGGNVVLVGDTSVDLSGYIKADELADALEFEDEAIDFSAF